MKRANGRRNFSQKSARSPATCSAASALGSAKARLCSKSSPPPENSRACSREQSGTPGQLYQRTKTENSCGTRVLFPAADAEPTIFPSVAVVPKIGIGRVRLWHRVLPFFWNGHLGIRLAA